MIDLEKVFAFLNKYAPQRNFRSQDRLLIKDAAIFNEFDSGLKPDILYICEFAKFKLLAGTIPSEINALCVSDRPVADGDLDQFKHKLIVIDGRVELNDLYLEVSEYLDSCWKLALNQLKLSQSLISGEGLQGMIDTASDIFGNPLLLFDINYRVLAYSRNIKSDDLAWQEITSEGYCSYEMIELMLAGKLLESYESELPVYTEGTAIFPYNYQLAAIRIGEKIIGHLSLIEFRQSISRNDLELQKYLSELIACELQKDNSINQNKGVMYENFIADLFEGKIKNKKIIEERMKYLDFLTHENFYVFTVRLRPDSSIKRPLSYLRDRLEKMMSGCKSVIYRNDIVTLISKARDDYLEKSNFSDIAEFLRNHQLLGGISSSFQNITEARFRYLHSAIAIELGFRLNQNEAFYRYEDYMIYSLMENAEHKQDLKYYISPLLERLIHYDLRYGTDYTDSLYAYLCSGNNLTQAARIFDIHRNSMNYRIKKINEILEADINEADITFSLFFSFKILLYTSMDSKRDFIQAFQNLNR